ncbi:uncharacterized protein si:dkey-183p4.10 isoform X2 [Cololabis saira]|nr:uncharacterized protein si:dkey-183p4.10 isoform X2 [Cololabis saira]
MLKTKTDGPLLQEATAETAALLSKATEDILYIAEDVDEQLRIDESSEEEFKGAETPEDGYTSSDGDSDHEGSASGGDEEEDVGAAGEPGDLLTPARCCDELRDGNKEDRIFAEGQPLAPEGADNPQVRNKVRGESESDEEVAYIFPVSGTEMMMKGATTTEDEQESEADSSDSEDEGMKINQEDNGLLQETEDLRVEDPAKASVEFPSISVQNLQDLIAEVDGEEYAEKMADFSGEEHQEAGESFADYPSDFSSSEYAEDRGIIQENQPDTSPRMSQDLHQDRAATGTAWAGSAGDTDDDERIDEFLCSRDLELKVDEVMSLDVGPGGRAEVKSQYSLVDEPEQSDSDSSSEDERSLRRNPEENMEDCSGQKEVDELHPWSRPELPRWSASSDHHITNNRADLEDFTNWDFDVLKTGSLLSDYLLTPEDTEKTETLLNHRPSDDVNSCSAVKGEDAETMSPSSRGSVDDSFFFNTAHNVSGISDLGQVEDDEYEDERNWEQEQERIKAFYKFYDDSDDDNGREGRQIKVQFCADPLSQVIHYETESSDRESLSSSTDMEEDLHFTEMCDELREPENTSPTETETYPPNIQLPERVADLSDTQTCTRRSKILSMLKLFVTTGLVVVLGLLTFWLTTDQMDWLRHTFFS